MKNKPDWFESFVMLILAHDGKSLILSLGVLKHQIFGPLQCSFSFMANVLILDLGISMEASNLVLCNTNTNSLACTKRHDAKILDAHVQAFVVQQVFRIPFPKIGSYIWIIMNSKHIYQ
jgi:hypothetical protein